MFLLFIISLSIIVYFICLELDKPIPVERLPVGDCPSCSTQVESGWLLCAECRVVLREACSCCGRVHDVWVTYCPWCGVKNEGSDDGSH